MKADKSTDTEAKDMTENYTSPRDSDRLPTGFFEADEDGFIQTPDDPGTDGKATGIELCLYVPDPWTQTTGDEKRDEIVRALPQDGYPYWLEQCYPALNFDWGADVHAAAMIYSDYQDGESTDDLITRLGSTPDFVRIRNEGTIFYHLLDAWAEHCGVNIYPNER